MVMVLILLTEDSFRERKILRTVIVVGTMEFIFSALA